MTTPASRLSSFAVSALWRDRSGRFSPLRLAASALILGPAVSLAVAAATDGLGAKPLTEAIHQTGDWAARLLLISLAITPLTRIAGWRRPVIARRLIGLGALAFAVAHLTLYAWDKGWDLVGVASEIVLRFYLLIGFVALLGLIALGVSSTDAMIRRLGAGWRRLHRLSYPIAVLALAHFFLQTKVDVTEPTWMAGAFLLLMGYRLAHARNWTLDSPATPAALAIAAALATAALETAWYGLATGVPPLAILAANLDFGFRISPAWIVLAIGAAPVLYLLARMLLRRSRLERAA